MEITNQLLTELAPTGHLRAAINVGNVALAQRSRETGELTGLSVNLARDIGRLIGRPVTLIPFESAGAFFAAATSPRN